jgi:hypothetical protein
MKTTIKLIGITDLVAVIGRHGCRCKNALAGVFAKQKLLTLLLAGMLIVMSSCGDDNSTSGDSDLSGTISITPSTATVGATLTANYSGGSETVTYQWKRGTTSLGTAVTQLASEAGSYTVTVSATGCKSKTSAAVTVSEDTSGQLRLSNVDITFFDETDATDFGYVYDGEVKPLSDFITGTPKVLITGENGMMADTRKLTIELDTPKAAALTAFAGARGRFRHITFENITVTPSDAKVWHDELWDSTAWYYLQMANLVDAGVFLIYLDKDVTLNGSYTPGSITYTFSSVLFKRGWNYLIETWSDSNTKAAYTTSQTSPNGFTWMVFED